MDKILNVLKRKQDMYYTKCSKRFTALNIEQPFTILVFEKERKKEIKFLPYKIALKHGSSKRLVRFRRLSLENETFVTKLETHLRYISVRSYLNHSFEAHYLSLNSLNSYRYCGYVGWI